MKSERKSSSNSSSTKKEDAYASYGNQKCSNASQKSAGYKNVNADTQHMKSLNLLQNSANARFYNTSNGAQTAAALMQQQQQQSLTQNSNKTRGNNNVSEHDLNDKVKMSHMSPVAPSPGSSQDMSGVYNTDNSSMQHYDCNSTGNRAGSASGMNVQQQMQQQMDVRQSPVGAGTATNTNDSMQQQFNDCGMQQNSASTTPMHMSMHGSNEQQQNMNLNMPLPNSQNINMLANTQQQQTQRKNELATNSSPSAHRSPTPKPPPQRTGNARQQNKASNSNSAAAAANNVANLAQTAALNNHRSNLSQAAVAAAAAAAAQQEHLHSMQQFSQLAVASSHNTHQNLQHAVDYINLPQIGQNYSSVAATSNSYDLVGMNSVLQQRMGMNTPTNPLASPHQRLDQSPSTCSVNNFYLQNTLGSNEGRGLAHGTTSPATNNATAASAGSNANEQQQQQQQQQQMLQSNQQNNNQMTGNDVSTSNSNTGGTGTTNTMVGNLCSLSKLQQLTNGLDIQQPCNTSPAGAGQVNLTPPPHAMPHNSMTPPPHLLVPQQRNLSTPPTMLQGAQMTPLQYHKYYPGNMNIGSISAASAAANNKQQTGGVPRNTPSAPIQHIAAAAAAASASAVSSASPGVTAATAASRGTSNVHLGSNLMAPYGGINSYRMSTQQPPPPPPSAAAGYAAGSDYANSQLPMQMGVMNMQASQYQDACAIQRAAQQNSMYSTYSPYIPLNGPMRR